MACVGALAASLWDRRMMWTGPDCPYCATAPLLAGQLFPLSTFLAADGGSVQPYWFTDSFLNTRNPTCTADPIEVIDPPRVFYVLHHTHRLEMPVLAVVSQVLLACATAPYHGSLQQYTLSPLSELAAENDVAVFDKKLRRWQGAKTHELKVVQVSASTVDRSVLQQILISLESGLAAAAIVSIFSWPDVRQTYWLARGLWYWSLSLAVWAFLIASQQESILSTLYDVTSSAAVSMTRNKIARISSAGSTSSSHYLVLYFWQCPSMLMSYSWLTFLVALLIHICRPIVPLIRDHIWTGDTKVMILFLISFGAGVINFGICSVVSRGKIMRQPPANSGSTDDGHDDLEDLEEGKTVTVSP